MRILHLICSPRGHASSSAHRSRKMIEALVASNSDVDVTVRCLNASTMPHIDREFSMSSRNLSHAREPHGSRLLSDELIEEVVESEAIVLATPMHNLTIPSALKAWIDHVVMPNRTFHYVDNKMVGLLPDRPVFVSLSFSQANGVCDGADFLRPYLQTMFAAMGITSIEFYPSSELDRECGWPDVSRGSLDLRLDPARETEPQSIHALWSRYW